MFGVSRALLTLLITIVAPHLTDLAWADPATDRPFFVKWTDTGNNRLIFNVHFADAHTGWAVGDDGTILATRDGGTHWGLQNSGTETRLQSVYFVDTRTGWAVGDRGTILATRDGGASWEPQNSLTDKDLFGVHFADAHTGWAVGWGGTILATRDAGTHWDPQDAGTDKNLFGAYFADARAGWAVGERGTILATRDSGTSWAPQNAGTDKELLGVHFADAHTGWAVGDGGTILATRAGGTRWELQKTGTYQRLRNVQFADAHTGWAIGEVGTILATRDGGNSWQRQNSGTDKYLFGVHFVDARTGWAVGDSGTILATGDGGARWERRNGGTDKSLSHVHFADARAGWAVAWGGTIVATRDGGTSWEPQNSATDKDLSGVHFADAHTGWAVGERGTIVATRDGGTSWAPQNAGTDKNLFGVHFVDALTGWAVGRGGTIVATRNGGTSWESQNAGTHNNLSGVYFVDAHTGWAIGEVGTIVATRDGGSSWERQKSGTDKELLGVHFVDAHTGWAVGMQGTIVATRDGGTHWEPRNSGTYNDLRGLCFADAHSGWAVGDEGMILATRDGGVGWEPQNSGTNNALFSVHFADPQTGWVVGDRGTMLHSGSPIYPPVIKDPNVTAKGLGELDVAFRIKPDPNAEVTAALVSARVAEVEWTLVGAATKSDAGEGGWQPWHLTWKPGQKIGARSGDEIEYHVQLDDGGPPFGISLGKFTYDPWWAMLWRENQAAVISALSSFALLLLYAGYFAGVLLVAPARLALVGGAPALDSIVKPAGNVAFLWDLARKAFEGFTLPWLSRHPRVRRAWTALYSEGNAKLEDLGKAARSSFVVEPEVLDAWVARAAPKVESALNQLELFNRRQIYVAVAVRVRESGAVIDKPSPETLRSLFARDRAIISIIGAGGIGKSTLACAMARWALSSDPDGRLKPHRMLPVCIAQETTNLAESVTQELRRMLGEEKLPADLVRGLLSKQRLLVIVDALSERGPETQRHMQQIFAEDVPLNALVFTSRTEPALGAVDRTTLYPIRLAAGTIVPFIIGYLDRTDAAGELRDDAVQLQLAERIVALAKSGGQQAPITPLLVTLFVGSALRRVHAGRSWDDLPEAVPEVFVDYLRGLNATPNPDAPISDDMFIRAAQTVATVSLGKNLVPQDFTPQDATEALRKDEAVDQARALLDRLIASGVIERRTPGGQVILRFNLDPAAEYLAAIRRLFSMKAASRKEWQSYLSSLERTERYPKEPEGYLMALATCYKTYRREFSLPDVILP
jgi:photosystem II stability/assembly factor-like uncharacterized protein